MVTTGSGEPRPLYAALSLAERFPEAQQSAAYRMRLTRGSGGRPAVRLHTPLADDEVGRHFQHVLRTDYRRATLPLDEKAVYLQSYTGHAATDSQVAIHEELRRSRPDLTLYWCVANAATRVPEGGVPVLMYSRRWYELLGSAKYLVTNVDFERWFERRPGQRVLQTFHGYPSKSMGISMWRAKQFSRRKIEGELRRTSRDWDLILTPAPEMDAYYRTEYDYDGPILSHGYPRDDIFFSELADEVRERTRRALGIDGQTVVLYAPTWRDDLATRFGSSPLVQHLDLEQAAQALGDDHVLLLRGHRYHQAAPRSGTGPRVIDVTTYPEINDLLLASDVAVLDYSSIRFDFALTGAADDLPGPRPGPVHRRRAGLPLPVRGLCARPPRRHGRPGGGAAARPRRRTARPRRGVRPLQRHLQLPAGRTVGRTRGPDVLLLGGSVRLSRASGPPARSSSASPLRCTSRRCPRGRTAHAAARRRSGS